MTTTTSTSTTAEPGTAALLRRACAAEWTRLWTVRTTWWCLGAATLVIVGIGTLLGIDAAGIENRTDWPPAHVAGELALMPGQFALLALVVLTVASEYATGAIGSTLQWTPRRGLLLLARAVVPTAVVAAVGTVLVLVADLLAWTIAPVLELTPTGLAGSLGTVAGVLAAGSLLALGVSFAVRSTAGALASVVGLMLVLPLFLPAFGVGWLETVARYLPGGAALSLLDAETFDVAPAVAACTLLAWVVAALAAGTLSLLRRDAT